FRGARGDAGALGRDLFLRRRFRLWLRPILDRLDLCARLRRRRNQRAHLGRRVLRLDGGDLGRRRLDHRDVSLVVGLDFGGLLFRSLLGWSLLGFDLGGLVFALLLGRGLALGDRGLLRLLCGEFLLLGDLV